MIIVFSIVTVIYILLILALLISWESIPSFYYKGDSEQSTKISVVISVRNEGENISQLLKDINGQTYPFDKFEVIITDDFSSDDTVEKINSCIPQLKYKVKLLSLPEHLMNTGNKKACIQKCIDNSTGDLIITTDGDCRVGDEWISVIEHLYVASKCKLITAPVTFLNSKSVFKKMQIIEFASLMGSGAASLKMGFPNMCNGANLAYEKKVFYEVNGFEGNQHVASGDDEFLMHKVYEKYPDKVLFLKNSESIVTTEAKDTLGEFVNQRKRWAGKWSYYKLYSIKTLAFFIFLYNLSLLVVLGLVISGQYSELLFLEQIVLKILVEFVFLKRILKFSGKRISFLPFVLLQLVYPFYVTFFALGGLLGNYEWKGRKLKTIKL